MRNCLYVGKATRWLKEQARNEWFIKATDRSLDPNKMRDREAINRFCGFYLLGVEKYELDYKGDMDKFLAEALNEMNKKKEHELQQLASKFELSMKNNFNVFNEQSFRKHTPDSTRRSVINIALFDIFSVVMTRYNYDFVVQKKEVIHNLFYLLMKDDKDDNFNRSITLSTNNVNNVKYRFEAINKIFREKLNVNQD